MNCGGRWPGTSECSVGAQWPWEAVCFWLSICHEEGAAPGLPSGGDLLRTVCAPGLWATRLSQEGRAPAGAQGGHVDWQNHLSLDKTGG